MYRIVSIQANQNKKELFVMCFDSDTANIKQDWVPDKYWLATNYKQPELLLRPEICFQQKEQAKIHKE